MWRNWNSCSFMVAMYNGAVTVESGIGLVVLQNVKHRIKLRPRNSTLRYIYLRSLRLGIQTNICT